MKLVDRQVPASRILKLNQHQVNSEGDFVVYWMVASRRAEWNFSLQHAANFAAELDKPLVILEALRTGYRWASDRIHAFLIQGMQANQRAFSRQPVLYYPYLEQRTDEGKGLLESLARQACAIVTDDFPCFFVPQLTAAAARKINVPLLAVDSNGLLPIRGTDRLFRRAHDFRRYLQKSLLAGLPDSPLARPLQGLALPILEHLPAEFTRAWPPAALDTLDINPFLATLPVNHDVSVAPTPGGAEAAQKRLADFCSRQLSQYSELRNQPEQEITSGLSPYLHFGHLAVHEVFDAIVRQAGWSPALLPEKASGSSSGWWQMDEPLESFLDELLTWREVGFNFCALRDDYDQYSSLPDWALKTLDDHRHDPREYVYDLEEFDKSLTHDPLWNAAQTQLVREGRIHNYLRMLWGKKILHWSASPEKALDIMIELNNRYALDGRDPNSYSGIFWVLGRYDRAWGPERQIFGKVRYMTSENTARKVKVKQYIRKYSSETQGDLFDS